MSAVIIDIADGIASTLNAALLSQPFAAVRSYVPVHTLTDLLDLHVSVVPSSLNSELLDRAGRNFYDFSIDIGVQKVIGQGVMTNADINAACDPLMMLAQEIADLFKPGSKLASYPTATCTSVANVPIFSPQHIDEKRVFTSVVSLTFKLGR